MEAIWVRPWAKNVEAAMISMAALTNPASPMAMVTSINSKRNNCLSCPGLVVGMRPWVRAECRKITCGMTVAPRMPVASRTLSVPENIGTTA